MSFHPDTDEAGIVEKDLDPAPLLKMLRRFDRSAYEIVCSNAQTLALLLNGMKRHKSFFQRKSLHSCNLTGSFHSRPMPCSEPIIESAIETNVIAAVPSIT